jgi:protein TonB
VEAVDSDSGPAVPARDLEALVTPEPVYPPEAFRNRVEGWAEIEFTVDERGATGDIVVVAAEPSGVFDAAATEAVAAWRYLPRVVNGQPVAQRTSVTLRFSVED